MEGQSLNLRDKKALEELERDIKAVRKARENLGDKAPQFGSGPGGHDQSHRRGTGGARGGRGGGGSGTSLGKRRRDDGRGQDGEESDDDSTTESVRGIPMPRDTPPPIPPEYLRPRDGNRGNPNLEPLGENARRGPHESSAKPEVPQPPTQTVYEAKPVVRDLRKEAVSAFVPDAVRQKLEAKRGKGRLLEPEELEKLEREGYGDTPASNAAASTVIRAAPDVDGGLDTDAIDELEAEQRRFERDMRMVQMEEVEDEDG